MELNRKASTAAWWARCLCGIWALGWSALLGACGDPVGTAIYVTIDFPPSLAMDQLRVSGTVAGSDIGPQLLPENAERTLTQGETFRVLLPDAPDKARAELQVEGLSQGTRVALGASQVQIREGSEVDVTVQLVPSAPSDVCANCPDGCCSSGVCTPPTLDACGTGGNACVTCDPLMADSCSSEGACACGATAACDPLTADACKNGACRCGRGDPCGFGQQCVEGRCVCTPTSCSGCCAFNLCLPGTMEGSCGKGGATCDRCDDRETCSDGRCT